MKKKIFIILIILIGLFHVTPVSAKELVKECYYRSTSAVYKKNNRIYAYVYDDDTIEFKGNNGLKGSFKIPQSWKEYMVNGNKCYGYMTFEPGGLFSKNEYGFYTSVDGLSSSSAQYRFVLGEDKVNECNYKFDDITIKITDNNGKMDYTYNDPHAENDSYILYSNDFYYIGEFKCNPIYAIKFENTTEIEFFSTADNLMKYYPQYDFYQVNEGLNQTPIYIEASKGEKPGTASSGNSSGNSSDSQGEISEGCNVLGNEFYKFLQDAFTWIQVIGPILALVLSMVDFATAVASGEDDAKKKATKKASTRILAAFLLFLIPAILKFILSLSNKLNGSTCGIE